MEAAVKGVTVVLVCCTEVECDCYDDLLALVVLVNISCSEEQVFLTRLVIFLLSQPNKHLLLTNPTGCIACLLTQHNQHLASIWIT